MKSNALIEVIYHIYQHEVCCWH